MTKREAFLWGALGGFLPVLLGAVTVDIAPLIDHPETLSLGECVGYAIRVGGLLVLGGVIALLNDEIRKPLALVQLGIAAPALVTAYVSGRIPQTSVPTDNNNSEISVFTPAMSDEKVTHASAHVAGFFSDVGRGLTTPLGAIARDKSTTQYPSIAAPNTPAVGRFCTTSKGRFGPGPTQPLGADCSVTLPSGPVTGKVTK